jgi:hypothetical protein
MEHENNYASKGVAGTALGLGIGALGVELLGGNLAGLFGNKSACNPGDHAVTRYEAEMASTIAKLESERSMDSKVLDLYKYIDGKLAGIEAQFSAQGVINAQLTANLACMQNTINTLSGLTKTVIPIASICPTPAVATTTA